MTQRQNKKLLRKGVLPVILGNDLGAHRLCLRIRILYGLPSLLCAPKPSFFDRCNPFAVHYPLMETDLPLLRLQLTELAARYDGCLLILIGQSPQSRAQLRALREELESAFILATPDDLWDKLPPVLR